MKSPEILRIEKQPIEIERKFLVSSVPDNLQDYEHMTIHQGYLVIGADGSEARIRNSDGIFTMTVKTKGELCRGEWEVKIDIEQFNELWPSTVGKRVEKTRYKIPYKDSVIELDIYEGDLSGLISAEVEFPNEDKANTFNAPEWFIADVTNDKAFKNQKLALYGLPK